MRTIKFRGKRVDNGGWVEGYLTDSSEITTIRFKPQGFTSIDHYDIDPATIGQFTGLTDKNGKEIFEGDFLLFADDQKSEVKWLQGGLTIEADFGDYDLTTVGWAIDILGEVEVAGNIHDKTETICEN